MGKAPNSRPYIYGRKYIEPFNADIDEFFMKGTHDNKNKFGPSRMLEMLKKKYSSRLDLPDESEIRKIITSLFAKFKKQGNIETEKRGIQSPYRELLHRIV